MAMILYKTGDRCPCCGQPIKLTSRADLYAFSAICEMTGLNNVGRTENALNAAEARRKARREPEAESPTGCAGAPFRQGGQRRGRGE